MKQHAPAVTMAERIEVCGILRAFRNVGFSFPEISRFVDVRQDYVTAALRMYKSKNGYYLCPNWGIRKILTKAVEIAKEQDAVH